MNTQIKWSVYWTFDSYNKIIFNPPILETAYTHTDINRCFRLLEFNTWEGFVEEYKENYERNPNDNK